MRSAAVAVFAGLATATYLPPAPVYEVPGVSAPASSAAVVSSAAAVTSDAPVYPSAPAEETEYSTMLVTITSCAPDVPDCPAGEATTVVSSSLIPMTTSTIYSTTVKTIVSCAPEVPDCPAASQTPVYVTETIAISTTVCPVSDATATPTGYPPVKPAGTSSAAVHSSAPVRSSAAVHSSAPVYPPVVASSKPAVATTVEGNKPVHSVPVPAPSAPAEECPPSVSVKTIVYTTQLTRYETATVAGDCPEATKPAQPPVYTPPVRGSNTTVPAVPTYTAPVSAGAAGLSGSVLVAAMAAVAAFAFA